MKLLWSGSLPLPTSANRLVAPVILRGKRPRTRLVKTSEAKEWLRTARLLIRQQGATGPVAGPVRLDCVFRFDTIGSDLDNRLKALKDALTGLVWFDDCQVIEMECAKILTGKYQGPAVKVSVYVYDATEVEAELFKRLMKSKKATGQ